jgi:hypothetical protein
MADCTGDDLNYPPAEPCPATASNKRSQSAAVVGRDYEAVRVGPATAGTGRAPSVRYPHGRCKRAGTAEPRQHGSCPPGGTVWKPRAPAYARPDFAARKWRLEGSVWSGRRVARICLCRCTAGSPTAPFGCVRRRGRRGRTEWVGLVCEDRRDTHARGRRSAGIGLAKLGARVDDQQKAPRDSRNSPPS